MLLTYSRMISRFLGSRIVRQSNGRRRHQRQRPIAIEALEVRTLLAAPLVSEVLGGTAGTEIIGTVYEDLDSNGVKSPGENGVSGWTVYLDLDHSGTLNTDAVGVLEPSALTNVDGDFAITHLMPGTYRLSEVVQPGWTPTAPASQDVEVRGDHTTQADFFNFAGGEIVGAVWNDLDNDGIRATDPVTGEFTEPGLANWTIYLDLNNSLAPDPDEPTTLTDADGHYSFSNLPAADYEVTEVLPDGWEATKHFDIRQTATVVALGQAVQDFANFSVANGSIRGTIWNDLNANGVRDTDSATGAFTEPGLQNWTVFVDLNFDGSPQPDEPSVLTDSDGEYTFISLPEGDHEVTEVLPDGWYVSPGFDVVQTVTVFGGEASFAQDFANFTVLNGSIRGTVWNDLNRDGIRNVSLSGAFTDPGLQSWQIFLDLNRNKLLDSGEPVTATDVNGQYFFADLQVGDYEVQEVLPTGWEVTTTYSDSQTVTVFSGTESTAPDFANFNLATALPGTVSGVVWNDLNGNGVRDVNAGTGAFTDPGLAGWVVFADLNANGALDTATEPSATTAANGSYSLPGILPGTVRIVEIVQPGWRATAPISGSRTIALKNGENASGLDFGNYTLQESAISGTVFADSNHNGSRDAGERGLAGITVYLDTNGNGALDPTEPQLETSGDLFFTPALDEAGTYSFTHLAAGTYIVRAVVPATLSATPAAELTHTVILAAAEARSGVNTAAVFRPNEIHGVKFDDSNGNHQRDAGEPGVGGVTIYIDLDRDDSLDLDEPTTVTLDDGSYSFGDLTPGAYVVREIVEPGHEATYPNTVGGTLWPDGISNPAVGNVTPASITTSLTAGQSHLETVSITLPNTGALTNLVDVFLLFDDTGSFVNNSPIVRAAFPTIITQLQTALPGIDLGFGVGRFEEYANFAFEYATGRPFVLNQPIVAASTPGYMTAIQAALNRTTPGYGGDQPETDIEALYQLVTGLGFDGNNNGSVLDSGAAGLASTQLNPGNSGDVPSFASFVADTAHGVMSAAGTIGGGGFRAGALPIILTATDTGFAFQPQGEATITGLGGLTLPLSALTGTSRPTTPFNYGAGIQQTVTALNALGALVIGLGTNPQANLDPRQGLEALSKLTGAVNHSTTTIANGTADPIAPGDPLYFQIASGFAGSVADGVVNAIQNAATNVAVDITVQASDPRVKIVNHSGTRTAIGSGQTATFDIEFIGDGVPRRFDLQFVRAGTNVVLGSIPVVIGTPIPGNCYEFEDLPEGEIHHSVDFGSRLITGVTTPTIAVSGGTFTYDAAAHAASATATDGSGTTVNGSFTFTYNGSTTAPVNAGIYDVVATFVSADPNFSDATGTATLTISAATPAINVTAGTVTFDGAAHAASATATGVLGESVGGAFTFTYGGSATAPIDVGVYDVVATFTSSDTNYSNATGMGTLTIALPVTVTSMGAVATPRHTAVSALAVTFSDIIETASLTASDFTLTRNGGLNLLSGSESISFVSGTTYRINGLTALTRPDGNYVLTVSAAGVLDPAGHAGAGSMSRSWTMDGGPFVLSLTPMTPAVRETPVDSLEFAFSEPIDETTFDASDLKLTRDGGVNLLTGAETIDFVGGKYRISGLAGLTDIDGKYVFTANAAAVKDLNGNIGSGALTTSWTLKRVPPAVKSFTPVTPNPRNTPIETLDVTFTEPIDAATLDWHDVALTVNNGPNLITESQPVSVVHLSDNTWRIGGLASLTGQGGKYLLTVNATGIQDASGIAGTTSKSVGWTEDFTAPTVSVTKVAPNPRNSALDVLAVSFSESIQAATFDLSDVTLSRDGVAIALSGQTISQLSVKTFQLAGLAALTGDNGNYVLTIDPSGVLDGVGNPGSGPQSAAWVMDTLAPTSSVVSISPPTSLSLMLSIEGSDPVPANGAVPSGIRNYDIYVSTNGGTFAFWKTVTASTTSPVTKATFTAESDHTYAFRSIARDKAGNVENKPADWIDAGVSVPDLSPPQTQVTGIDDTSVSTFTVSMHGSDVGSNGIVSSFNLFVSIDGAAAKKVATIPGGPSDGTGIYHAQAQFRALSDGVPHTYRFYSTGKDGGGKIEAAPPAPADILVSASFPADQVTTFDVQKGEVQRSQVRYLDLVFSRPDDVAAIVASVNDGVTGNEGLSLKRYSLSGAGFGTLGLPAAVPLAGKVAAVGSQIAIDFGAAGLADGYYELGLDLDGNGSLETLLHFDRLQGDFNGDRIVDAADSSLLTAALGQSGTGLLYDLNLDGVVDGKDQSKLNTLLGRQLGAGLTVDD